MADGRFDTHLERDTRDEEGRDAAVAEGDVEVGAGKADSIDSLVVHLEDPAGGNGQLLLYVRLRDCVVLDDVLRRRISTALRTELSLGHISDAIAGVPVIPHNRTGKKLELPVKKILLGAAPDEVASRDVLADPTALEPFVAIATTRVDPTPTLSRARWRRSLLVYGQSRT